MPPTMVRWRANKFLRHLTTMAHQHTPDLAAARDFYWRSRELILLGDDVRCVSVRAARFAPRQSRPT